MHSLPTPIPGWFPGSVAWATGAACGTPAVAARLINTGKRGSLRVRLLSAAEVAGDLALLAS